MDELLHSNFPSLGTRIANLDGGIGMLLSQILKQCGEVAFALLESMEGEDGWNTVFFGKVEERYESQSIEEVLHDCGINRMEIAIGFGKIDDRQR